MERGIERRRRAWDPSDDDDRDSIGTAYEGRRCLAHDPVAKRMHLFSGRRCQNRSSKSVRISSVSVHSSESTLRSKTYTSPDSPKSDALYGPRRVGRDRRSRLYADSTCERDFAFTVITGRISYHMADTSACLIVVSDHMNTSLALLLHVCEYNCDEYLLTVIVAHLQLILECHCKTPVVSCTDFSAQSLFD